ncbi:helix-turn-helix domain-containing protein, partial [Paraclostridium sordellii]
YMIKDRIYKKNNFSSYIKDAIDFIHRNYYNDINLETVCNHLKLNKSYFCQIFKKETGYTFSDFLNRIRVEKSKEYLTENNDSILDIALSVGYNNHTYYTSIFKKYNGVTPKEYRQKI